MKNNYNGIIAFVVLGTIPLLLIMLTTLIEIPLMFVSLVGAYCSFSLLCITLLYAQQKGGRK